MKIIKKNLRLLRRVNFRFLRLLLYSLFRLWLKKIHNIKGLPQKGPCIIISNHTSYIDWIVLSAVYKEKYLVFLGNKELSKRPIVSWLMNLNILVYIDPEKPGYSYFREIIKRLKEGYIVVIYPEGTRSRNGKMIEPKLGFVKLALITGIPIIPIGFKGAFEILPPNMNLPKLKRCEIFVGNKIIVDKSNILFKDVFAKDNNARMISKESMREIAFRIMNVVRNMVAQDWDKSVNWNPSEKHLKYLSEYSRPFSCQNK